MKKKFVAGILVVSIFINLLPNTILKAAEVMNGKSLRYFGADRYKTSAAISKNGFTKSEYIVLTSGEDYPDALCAAPLAKKLNAPILLVRKNDIPSEIRDEIIRLNAKKIYIIGGKEAISLNVETELKALNVDVIRIWGQDRYDTSYEIAKYLNSDNAVVASGENFPDALSIAPIAAKMGWPILLTKKNSLPIKIKQYLDENKQSKVYVIGGVNAISEEVKLGIKNSERIFGNDRFKTNLEIAKYFSNLLDFNKVYIAIGYGKIGKEFADALSASPLAAMTSSYVFLTSSNIDDDIVSFIQEKADLNTTTIALGGIQAVPELVLQKATVKYTEVKTDDTLVNSKSDVKVSGQNIVLSDTVASRNFYIEANNVRLKNIEVKGTLFINPGKFGVATLDTVKASKIVVLSGAENSIYLKNVRTPKLEIRSSNVVRIVASEKTNIDETYVYTDSKLEVQDGTFGKVFIESYKLQTKGRFETLIINSKADIILNGDVVNLEVKQDCKIQLISSKIYKLFTNNKVEINADRDSRVEKIEGQGKVEVKGEGSLNDSTGNTSGGVSGGGTSSGGTSSDGNQNVFKVVATGESKDKSLKVTIYRNGEKYKINITTNKEQTITMKILDSQNNLKYIDQIDKLNGSKEISTIIDSSNNTLFIRGILTEILEIKF